MVLDFQFREKSIVDGVLIFRAIQTREYAGQLGFHGEILLDQELFKGRPLLRREFALGFPGRHFLCL